MKKNEDNFITLLLDETYGISPFSDLGSKESFSEYFERKRQLFFSSEYGGVLTQFLDLQGFEYHQISYKKDKKFFSLLTDRGEVEFPINWSLFEDVSNCLREEKNLVCKVKDVDLSLDSILKSLFKSSGCPIVVVSKNTVLLSFLHEQSDDIVDYIEGLISEVGRESLKTVA